MSSKLLTMIAAGALAFTATTAMAQVSGAPSNERDKSGQPTDSSHNSAQPQRGGTQGRGGEMGGNMGAGGTAGQGSMQDNTPLQPGGISPSEPPQGRHTGSSANPNPR